MRIIFYIYIYSYNMKILICLAMSCGLTAILYFYMKQRLFIIESRLNTLTELVQTIATEFYHKEKLNFENIHNTVPNGGTNHLDSNSSDSESESGSDNESESSSDSDSESKSDECEPEKMIIFETIPIKKEPDLEMVEVEVLDTPTNEPKIIPLLTELVVDISEPIIVHKSENTVKLIQVSDDESESVKQVVESEYNGLSLKELKQKVNDLGGPPLKTKQALLNFLKKKV